jgi:3-mercaptopyruvate sulfurtransferase SseA
VALLLKRRGITRVHPLEGGLERWKALGFPLRELPAPETGTDPTPAGGVTQVVERLVESSDGLAGDCPDPSEIARGLTVTVEHQRGNPDVAKGS